MTATTGLVTLVLALFAVVIGKDAILTGCVKAGMAIAVLALLGAAACALEATRAKRSKEATSVGTLRRLIDEKHWQDDEVDARYQTALVTIEQIERLRLGSKTRGRWLRASGVLQVLAVAALGMSTLVVLFTQH